MRFNQGDMTQKELAEIVGVSRQTINAIEGNKYCPDPWEKNILETRLLASDWPKGKAFTEEIDYEGRAAFRMLLPEYYRESCLVCHGQPKGELDLTSYPKEGGKTGDLAGAISIVIFR